MRRKFFLFILLMVFSDSAPALIEKFLEIPPGYQVKIDFTGENLKYQARWMGIKSAQAELMVKSINGNYLIQSFAHTTGWARALWEMDDWLEVETTRSFQPRTYQFHFREPFIEQDLVLSFDLKNNSACSERIWRNKTKRSRKEFQLYQGLDPVSLGFLVRSLDWKSGDKRYFEFTDGNDRYLILLEAGKTKSIKVKAGTFSAIELTPYLFKLPRKFERESPKLIKRIEQKQSLRTLAQRASIWLALEGARPFVLVEAISLIGYVSLELVEISP